ncbi:hypothetical protein MJ579_24090 [Klebsiella pneumoniae]|nr:hypothetical protein MJ579_24090 [Klebsiella pneumoniae]
MGTSGGEKSSVWPCSDPGCNWSKFARGSHLESLQLLHFHLGSQMANIRDIATGVRESARFYVGTA